MSGGTISLTLLLGAVSIGRVSFVTLMILLAVVIELDFGFLLRAERQLGSGRGIDWLSVILPLPIPIAALILTINASTFWPITTNTPLWWLLLAIALYAVCGGAASRHMIEDMREGLADIISSREELDHEVKQVQRDLEAIMQSMSCGQGSIPIHDERCD